MNNFIIDFDSTFIKVESLDELFKISSPNNTKKINEFNSITNDGMNGRLTFTKSLSMRIKLLEANKKDIFNTVNHLQKMVTSSFVKNEIFFKKNKENIYIVSSGFHEMIDPIVQKYHIIKKNIYANNFTFDKNGNIIGIDTNNPLSKTKGKVEIIKNLKLKGTTHVIGDGFTDYEIKKEGYAEYFYLFIENIKRESLINNADFLLKSLEQLNSIIK